MKFSNTKSLSYNNVNLIAQSQNCLASRKEVPRADIRRIIVSPMDSIVDVEFALEALKIGLSVVFPRFRKGERSKFLNLLRAPYVSYDRFSFCKQVPQVWVAISVDELREIVFEMPTTPDMLAIKFGINNSNIGICLDIANGYLKEANYLVKKFYKKFPFTPIMVGNVHSAKGFSLYNRHSLFDKKAKTIVRVGIGGGSVCKTSMVTGYTRGQITEIRECYNSQWLRRIFNLQRSLICADGGIKTSGDIVKAFSAGADYVMVGGLLKHAKEARNVKNGSMAYYGGASHKQQEIIYGEVKRHSEGIETIIQQEPESLFDIVSEIWGGISSGVSYSGFSSVEEMIGRGIFEVKHN